MIISADDLKIGDKFYRGEQGSFIALETVNRWSSIIEGSTKRTIRVTDNRFGIDRVIKVPATVVLMEA